MLKKVIIVLMVLILALSFVGCGSSKSELTLATSLQAYKDAGIDVGEDKPLFTLINAQNGAIFYIDGDKVALYEYRDEKTLNKEKKENSLITDWPSKGKVLLESDNERAIEIFNSLE